MFALNGYSVRPAGTYHPSLHHIAPVHVSGPVDRNVCSTARDGPTYHIDCVFLPTPWVGMASVGVGSFEAWCGAGFSDHVPVVVDVEIGATPTPTAPR